MSVYVCAFHLSDQVKFLQSMNLLPSFEAFEAFEVIRLAHSHGTWIFTHHSGRSEQYAYIKWLLTHCTSGALPKHLCQELYGTNRTSINRNIFYSNKSIVSVHLLRIQSIFMQRTPTHTHTHTHMCSSYALHFRKYRGRSLNAHSHELLCRLSHLVGRRSNISTRQTNSVHRVYVYVCNEK